MIHPATGQATFLMTLEVRDSVHLPATEIEASWLPMPINAIENAEAPMTSHVRLNAVGIPSPVR
eukprot:COSAG01_NODE_29_length_36232_cov_689.729250_16_plen_64_part_00